MMGTTCELIAAFWRQKSSEFKPLGKNFADAKENASGLDEAMKEWIEDEMTELLNSIIKHEGHFE
jgi:hypothetical protein